MNGTAGTAAAIAARADFTVAIRGPCLAGVTDLRCQMIDVDDDGAVDGVDNCPFYATPNRDDSDGDGRGNDCECGDQNGDGRNTVADLVAINTAVFSLAKATPLCDGNNDDLCNVNDIIAANIGIFSPTNTSTCARQPVPGPYAVVSSRS